MDLICTARVCAVGRSIYRCCTDTCAVNIIVVNIGCWSCSRCTFSNSTLRGRRTSYNVTPSNIHVSSLEAVNVLLSVKPLSAVRVEYEVVLSPLADVVTNGMTSTLTVFNRCGNE